MRFPLAGAMVCLYVVWLRPSASGFLVARNSPKSATSIYCRPQSKAIAESQQEVYVKKHRYKSRIDILSQRTTIETWPVRAAALFFIQSLEG